MSLTYALLGGTGNVGNCILEELLAHTGAHVNVLVRSTSKLQQMSPDVYSSPRLTIFCGNITDLDTLASCLKNTSAAFLAVASATNTPGIRIAQDQAEAVTAALDRLHQADQSTRLPKLVVLSSAEAETETELKFSKDVPWLIRKVLFWCNSYLYHDLIKAEDFLRKQKLVGCVFVKPGGLSHDKPSGHELSEETQQTFLSFKDLAAGMVEVAEDQTGKWIGKSVSVVAKSKAKMDKTLPLVLFKGLLVHFFPRLHGWVN